MHAYTCACTHHVCVCMHAYVFMYVYACMHMYVSMYLHYACMYVCMYVRVRVCSGCITYNLLRLL